VSALLVVALRRVYPRLAVTRRANSVGVARTRHPARPASIAIAAASTSPVAG